MATTATRPARRTETRAETVQSIFGAPGQDPAPRAAARRPPANPTTGRVTGGLGGTSRPAATRPRPATPARPAPAAPSAPRSRQPATARRSPQRRSASRGSSGLRTARAIGRAAAPAPEFANYQGIILAEFVAAELLVAGTPIATRQNQPGLSPYVPRDMTKLLALGLLYFLLELMAVGGAKAGRLGAWFGGLILLTVGLNEAANVAKVLDIFSGRQQAPAKAQASLPTGAPPGTIPA